MATDNDAYQELPFRENGWHLRYLVWSMGEEAHPSFAPGSIVVYAGIDADVPRMFRIVWLEPVE